MVKKGDCGESQVRNQVTKILIKCVIFFINHLILPGVCVIN